MRNSLMFAAGACLLALTVGAAADPAVSTNASQIKSAPPLVLAQAEPKKETVSHKVERKVKKAWHKLTGYKFDVACLTEHTTCTEGGKDKGEARGKCISAHPLCWVSEAN